MLLKKYKTCTLQETNINMSKEIIGIPLFVSKEINSNLIDDFVFRKFCKINNTEYQCIADEYEKIMTQLNVVGEDIDYLSFLNKNIILKKLEKFKSILSSVAITDYYDKVLRYRYMLTNKVSDAAYCHSGSLTGRMTIKSGKQHLTVKKEERNFIKSDPSNVLIEIDISACEPALMHKVLYDETISDIYGYFMKKYGVLNDRKNVKLAVISTLYGATARTVRRMSGCDKKLVSGVRSHFKIDEINEFLTEEYNKNGNIINMYGRPIYSKSSLVNYWLQSSSADYACLAFYNLITSLDLKVHAVIHDAIIVEATQDQLYDLDKIETVTDPNTNISLYVKKSIISE